MPIFNEKKNKGKAQNRTGVEKRKKVVCDQTSNGRGLLKEDEKSEKASAKSDSQKPTGKSNKKSQNLFKRPNKEPKEGRDDLEDREAKKQKSGKKPQNVKNIEKKNIG